MKIAITVTQCRQIGIDTWKDLHTTKVFDEGATIKEINEWIQTIDKTWTIANATVSSYVD